MPAFELAELADGDVHSGRNLLERQAPTESERAGRGANTGPGVASSVEGDSRHRLGMGFKLQ